MKSILDKSFHYTKAVNTDIRKTIRKERERLKREANQPAREVEPSNVHTLTPGKCLLRKGGA